MVTAVSTTRHTEAVRSAAETLTALAGTEARVSKEPRSLLIEVDVTDSLRHAWPHLLAVLNTGDTFGLHSSPTGQVAWLRLTLKGNTHDQRPDPKPPVLPEQRRDL